MSKSWRRFEVLLPLQFNDGRGVPERLLAKAVFEIVDEFGAISNDTQKIKGIWRHNGTLYREKFTRVVVDVPDMPKNRKWMKQFKKRWRNRLRQIQLWVVSYRVEIE